MRANHARISCAHPATSAWSASVARERAARRLGGVTVARVVLDAADQKSEPAGQGEYFAMLREGWPTTGKVFSDRLKRLQPTLAARGVPIDSGRTREGRYIEMPRSPAGPPQEQERAF